MRLVKSDLKYLLLILLTSIFTVTDLFINVGRSANGDGLIHTVVPTLFAKAISQGNFPVGWLDGFANYGLPLGTISQQLTTYLVAFITIIFHNPAIGFNIVTFLAILLASLFLYLFLRIYFLPIYSFAGVFLFNFTPYRILNIYIRGALPEFFATLFFPLLLISLYLFIKKKNIYGLFLFIISITLLTLTHPFMLIVVMFLLAPYFLFLLLSEKSNLKTLLRKILSYGAILGASALLGVLITAYYVFPLLFEIKYFYYGTSANHLTPNNFLGLKNFFLYNYPYFTRLDIFDRGFWVNVGAIESALMIIGTVYFLFRLIKNKLKQLSVFDFAIVSGIMLIFMMTSFSTFLYTHISFLSNIQFPWRILAAFIFIPPILLTYFLSKLHRKSLIVVLVLIICVLSFPQLYGKNYTHYPASFYTFTAENLDAVVMNTIWIGRSEDYPIKSQKWNIIEGKGSVLNSKVSNSIRTYQVSARTQIRMVDYTFYFPGWKVYVDGNPVTIEFQNPDYRGVITYLVPPGNHTVIVKYTDTKIRLLGKILTIIFFVLFAGLFLSRRFVQKIIQKFLGD